MLCVACQDIFSTSRELSCGTYYPWKQDVTSFQAALPAGCHLCNLVEENRSYNSNTDDIFPTNTRYAFKALNPVWACSGRGPKWLVPETSGDNDEEDPYRYWQEFNMDPTPNRLGSHLATESETLIDEMANSWLVLEFYGSRTQVVLPMEIATQNEFEELAQKSINEQTSTGCHESLQLAKSWLHNCLTSHTSCKPLQPEAWLPKRLLDVGYTDATTIRLILSSSLHVDTQYAALSHRWGTEKCCVLDSANVTAFQETISLSNISATIRDSVAVTRALGLQYLWVDSMCIVQDDPDDWARESATMSKVYGLATCTIAAANSGCGGGGFLTSRNPYRVRSCRVPNPFKMDSKHSFYIRSQYLHKIHDRDVRRSLWYNRGWVFQERTLSPRLVVFCGTQILWACERLQAAETWPCGKTRKNYIDQFESFTVEKARFYELLNRWEGVQRDHSTWWNFLQDYIKSAELTNRSDRLAAILGIATLIQGLTGENYCAGFWLNDDLPAALLWRIQGTIVARSTEYRAPSWSWAAVEGTIQLNTVQSSSTTRLLHILGHECLQRNQTRGGRNIQEVLRVTGSLVPVAIMTSRDGASCDRVVTVEYSKTAECISLFENSHKNSDVPKIVEDIGGSGNSEKNSDVPRIVVLLGRVPGLLGKILWACWVGLIVVCCVCVILGAEWRAKREDKREAKRRAQQRADAVARRERILDDLERGIPLANIVEVETEESPIISANCSLDALLPETQIIQVVLLPVVSTRFEVSGLLLCLVDGTEDHYERLGVFSASKLSYPSTSSTIILV